VEISAPSRSQQLSGAIHPSMIRITVLNFSRLVPFTET
jgi:hypothetical protein